jgi:hypothetical protein
MTNGDTGGVIRDNYIDKVSHGFKASMGSLSILCKLNWHAQIYKMIPSLTVKPHFTKVGLPI